MPQILGQRIRAKHRLELTKSHMPGLQAKSDNPMANCHQPTATSRLPMRVFLTLSAALVLCDVFSISQSAVAQGTFTNPTPIFVSTIQNLPPVPYPSNIAVSGLPGSVTKVTVTLNNLNFDNPSEADILLVGPNGQSVTLMSDATGGTYNMTLTFDDAALSPLPSDLTLRSGSYKPTDFDPADDYYDVFPAPAPVEPYGTTLSVFNGTNPHGTWSLYTVDDIPWDYWDYDEDVISGGWSLTVTAAAPSPNPLDDSQLFVGQQYRDFLNREPEQSGSDYWTNEIARCSSDPRCIHERRIGVSAAFFVETEFQESGYYIYRLHKASFGRQPSLAEFMADRAQTIIGPNLEGNKQAFAEQWVQRSAFLQAYPNTMSNTEFVNKLFDTAGLTAPRFDPQRQQEIAAMNAGRSRAVVLRDVIEIPDFRNVPDPTNREQVTTSQYNPAFVLMQYFGYLRRDPDPGGYRFWLEDVLNNREPNNYRGMVCAFLTSTEYQLRFGSVVTRSNADCSQSGKGAWDY